MPTLARIDIVDHMDPTFYSRLSEDLNATYISLTGQLQGNELAAFNQMGFKLVLGPLQTHLR